MSLSAGTRLGPYEIVDKLGAGGMGEVYRARDTRLDRIVAIKVSKSEFDERFDREARAVAALNHPHICQLYDVGPNYLVMEYLEGTPLQGPLPIAKAVEYAMQILDALDAAHRKGIVHRDLKPANILVTRQGIKLLDFGLAKQAGGVLKESDATLTEALTTHGQIVGTLQYMSPEQVQGLAVDTRSDIFSFGLVLYEIIAGRRAFEATSGAGLIATVLKDQPRSISEVRTDTPPALDRIIGTCLEKDPDDRWQSARDLRREMEWLQKAPEDRPRRPARIPRRFLWLALIPAAFALGFAIALRMPSDRATSFDALPLTTLAGIEAEPALSPDGKLVAFSWTGPNYGATKICVKQLDASEPLVLSHSDASHGSPAWSPDGRQVAYLRSVRQGLELVVVPALGGPERRIGEPFGGDLRFGMCWLPVANKVVFSAGDLTAMAVDSGQRVRLSESPAGKSDAYPALSPDGRNLAFIRTSGIAEAPSAVISLHLDAKQAPDGPPKVVTSELQGVGGMAWAPDGRSLIVSALSRGSHHLFRVQFPSGKIERLGGISAAGILGGGISISAAAKNMAVAVAENDMDIWRVAGPAWPAKEQRPEPQRLIASTRDDVSPDFSPDGKRIAFESRRTGTQEIWSVDAEGHDAVQLTNFGGPAVGSPRWSPDGSRIVFDSRKAGKPDIFVISSNGGAAIRLTTDNFNNTLPAWSADGRSIFYTSDRGGRTQIWKIPADGGQSAQVTQEGGMAPQHIAGDSSLYYWAGVIWRMPDGGGKAEKVLGYGSPSFWAPWSGGLVAFGNFTVYSIPFHDPKPAVLQKLPQTESPRFLRRPSMAVSKDGRWVLVTLTALDRGDLVLIENFR
jgi:Tol biopolymer transport system component/predicted Ser/Thr protein kinase